MPESKSGALTNLATPQLCIRAEHLRPARNLKKSSHGADGAQVPAPRIPPSLSATEHELRAPRPHPRTPQTRTLQILSFAPAGNAALATRVATRLRDSGRSQPTPD